MSERRLLALLALLLGLLGVLLVVLGIRLPRENQAFLAWLADVGVRAILALVAVGAFVLIYNGNYRGGGIIAIVVGIALLIVDGGLAAALLIVFAGILGLVAAGTFDRYR